MELLITSICIIIFVAYILLIVAFIKGWDRGQSAQIVEEEELPFLSCIIAFRNEEDNILGLLQNLNLLSYPKEKVEFILVNDGSTDDSLRELNIHKELFHFNTSIIENKGIGKKSAIRSGVDKAKWDNIVLTDADCQPHQNWLLTIGSCFVNNESDMIVGPVYIKPSGDFLSYFQSVDFISLITSTAGAIGINKPIMCNGANLSYKKAQYFKVNHELKDEYLSGDDVFLLHAMKREGANIHFLKSKDAIVTTNATFGVISFLKQRVRWASKSKGYSDLFTLLTAWLVFLTNLLAIASICLYPLLPILSIGIIAAWVVKLLVDCIILKRGASFFNLDTNIQYSILTFVLYPIYIVVTVFWAAFGFTKWKDRTV